MFTLILLAFLFQEKQKQILYNYLAFETEQKINSKLIRC